MASISPAVTPSTVHETVSLTLDRADIDTLFKAQKLCASFLGQDLPIELLAGIAIRGLHPHTFAMDVLSTITNAELPLDDKPPQA